MYDKNVKLVSSLLCFLVTITTSVKAADFKGSYTSYLESIKIHNKPLEYTFNSNLQPIGDNYFYNVDNVIVFLDMSGSTAFSCIGSARSRHSNSLFETDLDPTPQDPCATKHISLAEMEALSLVLKYFSKTTAAHIKLYMLGFSTDIQKPINISFPHTVEVATEFEQLAINLPNNMPNPSFGGTDIVPALEIILNEPEFSGNTLLVLLTDGHIKNPETTANLLNELKTKLETNQNRLDTLIIGAGSIAGSEVVSDKIQNKNRRTLTDNDRKTRLTTSILNYKNGTCNYQYLESLSNFISKDGYGEYVGAYRDYRDLNAVLHTFFSVNINKCHHENKEKDFEIFVYHNDKKFFKPLNYQIIAVKEFWKSNQNIHYFDYNGYKLKLEKYNNDLILVTNESNKKRYYLTARTDKVQASLTNDGNTYTLSSYDHNVEQALNICYSLNND